MNGRPVFVGGCPRSGTTMLRAMLNSHPHLAVPHETRYVVDAYRRRRMWGDLRQEANRRKLARWVVDTNARTRVQRLIQPPERLVEPMVAAPPTIGSVLAAGLQVYAARHGKARWGDKRPSYAINLDAVFAMFPDAQFVNVVRDPRAAIASIMKVGWFEDGFSAGLELWQRSVSACDAWRRKLPADAYHEIVYEQLVADPRAEVEKLVAFLDLDPAHVEDMLNFHENIDIKSRQIHPLVDKPVTDEALRSWEGTLERAQVALIERELAEPMARYGYEPVASGADVPPVLLDALALRRKEVRHQLRKERLRELSLRLTTRRPVAREPYEPKMASTTRPDAPPSSSSQNVETNAS